MGHVEQVNNSRIADGAVDSSKILDGSITGTDIAAGTIDATNVNTADIATLSGAQTFVSPKTFERASNTDPVIHTKQTGDAQNRATVTAEGRITWGSGAAAQDLILERAFAAGMRVTADQFQLFNRTGIATGGFVLRANGALDSAYSAQVVGDGQFRYLVQANGKLSWSDGNLALDTALYRSAVGTLKTDANFVVVGSCTAGSLSVGAIVASGNVTVDTVTATGQHLFTGANAVIRRTANSGSSQAFVSDVVGDGWTRFQFDANGAQTWGPGTAVPDTNLYRSAVGTLKTDTKLVVGTNLQVDGNTALGNAITDLIGLYGETAVAQAAVIAAPTAPSIAYVQAEAQSSVAAINSIRAALAGIGITA